MSGGVDREADLDRVLAAADQVSGARRESLRWLRHPLKEFNGETAESSVAIGRADDVFGYLNSISSGFGG
jgi:hypothetical protein